MHQIPDYENCGNPKTWMYTSNKSPPLGGALWGAFPKVGGALWGAFPKVGIYQIIE